MHEEFKFLVNFFRSNGYCSKFVEKQISTFFLKQQSRANIDTNDVGDVTDVCYFSLPYFGPQSEKLKKEILSAFDKYFVNLNAKIVFTNKFTIGSFFNFKDKLPFGMLSSIVYNYCCERCSSSYVGATSRNLYMRVAEHTGKSFRTGRDLASPPNSVIRDHAQQCDVRVSLQNFQVLGTTNSFSDLFILESIHIVKKKPVLNNQLTSFHLSIVGK